VVGLARLEGDERVLDVGCGNGAYLEMIGGAVGLDASEGMLGTARGRASGPLVAGDSVRLPFTGGAFDVVLAAHMLYHVDDRPQAVRELRRVLRPGGVCIAVTNGEESRSELSRLVEDVVGHGWRWRSPLDVAFSLENGAEQLRAGFHHVRRVDGPPGTVQVTDAAALADYVASVGDVYQEQVAAWTTWMAVVEECRRRTEAVVEREGSFPVSSVVGAFVCW
jgi:SAM-dependent methyltransferase